MTGAESLIKWVNDIYCDGRKVAGILTEGVVDMESGHLMSDSAPVTCSIACAHATAAAHVMNWPRSAANVGRSTMLRLSLIHI